MMTKPIKQSPPIGYRLLGLALPVMAQSQLQTLLVLVDQMFLGHYGTEALAAMRLVLALFWVVMSLLSTFTVGAVALVGRAIGAQDTVLAVLTARVSLGLALGGGSIATLVSGVSLAGIVNLFPGVEPAVQAAAYQYLQIVALVLPIHLLAMTLAALIQAAGNTRIPFLVALLANSVNLGLDYVLIFGHLGLPRLGMRGAAIGSAVAIVINASLLGWVLCRGVGMLKLLAPMVKRAAALGNYRAVLQRLVRLSLPVLGERLVRGASYLGFTAIITGLGAVAMATHTAVVGIEEFSYVAAEGVGVAVAVIVAQQLGAQAPAVALQSVWVGMLGAISLLAGIGLLFLMAPTALLGLFSTDTRLLALGVPCLAIAAIAQPFMAGAIILEAALRGAGATRLALLITLLGWCVVRLLTTSLFVFVWDWGLLGVWWGSTCDWVVRFVVLVIIVYRTRWYQVSI
ncbi:MATE family efflux transporter [Trichothermofontia sp.]